MVNGPKIRLLRESKNLSTYKFADEIGISEPMVIFIEKNYKPPSVAVLKRIADFLGVKMDDLVQDAV